MSKNPVFPIQVGLDVIDWQIVISALEHSIAPNNFRTLGQDETVKRIIKSIHKQAFK